MASNGKHSINNNSHKFIVLTIIILIIIFIFINKSLFINLYTKITNNKTNSITNYEQQKNIEILSCDLKNINNEEYEVKIKIKNISKELKSPFILSVNLLDNNKNIITNFENLISATEPNEEIFTTKIIKEDLSNYSSYDIIEKEI